MGPGASTIEEACKNMSTNEERKRREQAKADAERVAEAIELIHATRFAAGQESAVLAVDASGPEREAIFAAWSLADSVRGSGGKALEMRSFQKAGISSRYVARCLREGVLVAVPDEGSDNR